MSLKSTKHAGYCWQNDEDDVSDPISNEAVRETLAILLASPQFARARRSAAFLQYIVDETLAGRGDRLKAFNIASDVFERDEDFDPRIDPIVRVEAKRLRDHLADYYADNAGYAEIHIEIPKGGYVPEFSLLSATQSVPDQPNRSQTNAPAPLRPYLARTRLALIAIVGSLLAVGLLLSTTVDTPITETGRSSETGTYLAVLPLDTLSNNPQEDQLAAGMVEAVVTDLTRLSGISVMAHASLLNIDKTTINLSALRQDFGVTHVLRGSLESGDEAIRMNVQLVDIKNGTTIWAERFDSKPDDLLDLQDLFAERIVERLSIPTSARERVELRNRTSTSLEALALYRQGLVMIMPPNDIERVTWARQAFQRAITLDPGFGGGYAGTGFSHTVMALFLKTAEPDVELAKGIELALRAIEIDPDFGMGYVTLALSYALSGRSDEALANARRAVSVQPGDAFTQFVYGLCLIYTGNPTDSIARFDEALRLDPAEPRTPYRNLKGIAYLATGDAIEANKLFDENLRIGGPAGPHMDWFRAIALIKLDETQAARSMIHDLLRRYPDFPVEHWVTRHIPDASTHSEMLTLLREHGFTG